MYDEFEAGVNELEVAEPTEQVETTEEVEQEEPQAENEEVAEPQKTVQDAETNAHYAEIRRRAEQEAKDKATREFTGGQFNTYAEYQQALQMQQWEQQGKDPELEMVKQEVAEWKREKTLLTQREALKEEPFFSEWLPDIERMVQERPDVFDYDIAYTIMARQHLRDVVAQAAKQSEQKTLQNVIDRNKKQVETTADAGHVSKIDVNALDDKALEELAQRALRGERIVL